MKLKDHRFVKLFLEEHIQKCVKEAIYSSLNKVDLSATDMYFNQVLTSLKQNRGHHNNSNINSFIVNNKFYSNLFNIDQDIHLIRLNDYSYFVNNISLIKEDTLTRSIDILIANALNQEVSYYEINKIFPEEFQTSIRNRIYSQMHRAHAVSYTHLTLPTICSV